MMRIDDGGTVLKRWIGPVAAAAAMLVMVSPAVARADFDEVACTDVTGEITSATGVGPGLVAVEGSVRPRAADVGTCDATATLTVFAVQTANDSPYSRRELGRTTVHGQDGHFAQPVSTGPATFAICLSGTDRYLIDCYQVTVRSGRDAAGEADVGTPIVNGRIDVYTVQPPSPPPCGHCM